MIYLSENFVHLHCHSNFSLLDGLSSVQSIVDKTLDMGQPAVAVTDHGNMFGFFQFFQYAQKKGQKAIAGFEAYVVADRHVKGSQTASDAKAQSEENSKREHLVILAKDNDGLKLLNKLCSIGWREGKYYRPRIDDQAIIDIGTKGLIASSACIAGRVAQALLSDDYQKAKSVAEHYAMLFPEGFWLEIQPTEMEEQIKVNKGIIDIAKETGIPLIVTTDAHYLNKEDKETHDVLLCMQTNKLITDPNRWQFHGNTYYVMSKEECTEAFNRSGHEVLDQNIIAQGISETVRIADMCNVELKTGVHYLPKIDIPTDDPDFKTWQEVIGCGNSSTDYLRFLSYAGLQRRGLMKQDYIDRIERELQVIHDMGFPDYFLIYEEIADYCRKTDLPMGPGRGCGIGENLVKTDNDVKRLDSILKGDKVLTVDGEYREVTDVHQYTVEEDLINIETEDGRQITMTADHKVLAVIKSNADATSDNITPTWVTISDLNEGDYIVSAF